MMSVIHRLAGKLFHRAGPCAGDADGGEDGHERPREELEACRWCEFSLWSRGGSGIGFVAHAVAYQHSQQIQGEGQTV